MVAEAGLKIGLRHFFFGGGNGVAEAAAARLKRMVPGTEAVGTMTPRRKEETGPSCTATYRARVDLPPHIGAAPAVAPLPPGKTRCL